MPQVYWTIPDTQTYRSGSLSVNFTSSHVRVARFFHVSQLKKYLPDPFQPVELDSINLKSDLTFQPKPERIVDRDVKSLRSKEIPIVEGGVEGFARWRNYVGARIRDV